MEVSDWTVGLSWNVTEFWLNFGVTLGIRERGVPGNNKASHILRPLAGRRRSPECFNMNHSTQPIRCIALPLAEADATYDSTEAQGMLYIFPA